MINIPPTSGNVTPVKPVNGSQRPAPVAPVRPLEEDTRPPGEVPFVERRKSTEERRKRSMGRGPYNQRAGRDRRRNSGRPSIDTEA